VALVIEDLDALLAGLAENGVEPEKPPYAPGGGDEYPPTLAQPSTPGV
jgi:lactoylglutathione lyase